MDPIAIKRTKRIGLIPFNELKKSTRDLEMLKWFVEEHIATIVVVGSGQITKTLVEMMLQNIPCGVFDDTVTLDHLEFYFNTGGRDAVKQVVQMKKLYSSWNCTICSKDSSTDSICCNRSLNWLNFNCVKVNSATFNKKVWFCFECKLKYSS